MLIATIALFVISLIVLTWGSDKFVKTSAAIAEKLGISEFMIGLTLVAVGTSLPELASSITAAIHRESGIVIGNIVGSNIANIGLVIGIASIICVIKAEEKMLIRDGFIMMFATIIFYVFMATGTLSRLHAVIFLAMYFAYIIFIFETMNKSRDEYHFAAFLRYLFGFRYIRTLHAHIKKEIKKKRVKGEFRKSGLIKDLLWVLVSLPAVILGAQYMVDSAVSIAQLLNVPNAAIGVSLVAFGTSVPELSVAVAAARKGYGNIAVGNIIGSNIANILLVGGASALISPLEITEITLLLTAPFMIITSLMLLFFIESKWQLHKYEGAAFIAVYLIFLLLLFSRTGLF